MFAPNLKLGQQLIAKQFPEYAHLPITEVEKQGHDNRSYRLGNDMLIRMPTAEDYALKIPIEQELLPKLQKYLTIQIPAPINMGNPSEEYPYPFSIYKYLLGKSINLVNLSEAEKEQLAYDLSDFLKELQNITEVILFPRLNQVNDFKSEDAQCIEKYMSTAESRKNRLDHLKMGNSIKGPEPGLHILVAWLSYKRL